MADSPNKKKSPVLLFFVGFLVIVGVMFIANYRSPLVQELDAPDDGIQKLYTVRDSLVAVSNRSEIYLWNWKELEDKAKIISVKAANVAVLPADKLVLVSANNSNTIIISDFENNSKQKQLSIEDGWLCKHLSINRVGRAAFGFEQKGETSQNSSPYGRIRLETIRPDFDKLLPVATIDKKDNSLSLYGLAISNDGAFIAVVGQKNDVGWVGTVDVAQKKLLWEKSIETSADITEIAFSPDDKVLYAGGEGRYLYCFETDSGKTVRKLLIDEEQLTVSFNEQRVTCTEVSPDGFVVAAGVNPGNKIYFWDTRTSKRLGVMGGCRGLNNLAFAPDSSTFVVAGRNYGGSLKVRRVPGK